MPYQVFKIFATEIKTFLLLRNFAKQPFADKYTVINMLPNLERREDSTFIPAFSLQLLK